MVLFRWMTAVVLGALGELLLTVAQFMPMKSIFLLAGSRVPGFFPQFLVDAGETSTAAVLIVVAIVMLFLGKFLDRLALRVCRPDVSFAEAWTVTRGTQLGRWGRLPVPVSVGQDFLLAATLLAVASFAAPFVAIFMVVAVLAVILFFATRIAHGHRMPPHKNGFIELHAAVSSFLPSAGLWIVVAASVASLLFGEVKLGITGVLLAAVLMRRFAGLIPALVLPAAAPLMSDEAWRGFGASTYGGLMSSPPEYLSTVGGRRLVAQLSKSLAQNQLSHYLTGRPNAFQMTLLVQREGEQASELLRLYSEDKAVAFEKEWLLRREILPLIGSDLIGQHLGGVDGFRVLHLRDSKGVGIHDYSGEDGDAISLQKLKWETNSLADVEIQARLAGFQVPQTHALLVKKLESALRIPGIHNESFVDLLSDIGQAREALNSGPRVVDLPSAFVSGNLCVIGENQIEPLNLSNWGTSLFGANWSNPGAFKRAFHKLSELGLDLPPLDDALLRCHASILISALGSLDFRKAASTAVIIRKHLGKRSE